MSGVDECFSCDEGVEDAPRGECPKSKRPCGHHCNCSWTQDECCWCGTTFGEVVAQPPSAETDLL